MHFALWQWLVGIVAGFLIGVSKTGIPGVGILTVPILAYGFGGWESVGIMLPMLVFGDCFAVFWYRRHAQWDKILTLLPWIITGMAIGGLVLWKLGESKSHKDILNVIIGILVLIMLALHLLQDKLGDKLTPRSSIGKASTGTAAGFATTVSNAAGPIMQMYMASYGMRKEEFMGTLAWYLLIFNTAKLPVFGLLTFLHPLKPMLTGHSLLLDLLLAPFILAGVFAGKWLFLRISQKAFHLAVLILAAVAAIKLIVAYWV